MRAFGKAYINFRLKRSTEKFGDSMNKKTIYIIVAVLIVVIVVAGAAAFLLMGTTPTPTPVPTVVGATTLQFSVNETTNGALVTFNFAAKDVNTTNEVLRLDIPGGSLGNYSYIINLATSTSFFSADNGATWTASDFATDSSFVVLFADYQTNLVNWNGNDATYSYTATSGASIVIYDISVNPTLADSLFATS